MINVSYITAKSSKFDNVKNIRKTVFLDEQNADEALEFDKYDQPYNPSIYAIIYSDENIAGTGRIILNEKGYKIGRIALLKEYRSMGLGRILVEDMLKEIVEFGGDMAFVDAQSYAVDFYKKIGFEVIGDEFKERNLSNVPMKIDLKKYTQDVDFGE